jgi:hypothetical protein
LVKIQKITQSLFLRLANSDCFKSGERPGRGGLSLADACRPIKISQMPEDGTF